MDKDSMSVKATSLLLFLLTFPNMVSGTDSCYNPGGSWKQLGQHYYWVTGNKLDYDDSRAECQKVPGGQLAEILDKATLLLMHNDLHSMGGGTKVFLRF